MVCLTDAQYSYPRSINLMHKEGQQSALHLEICLFARQDPRIRKTEAEVGKLYFPSQQPIMVKLGLSVVFESIRISIDGLVADLLNLPSNRILSAPF
jgi:hypothetical protein